MFSEPKIFSKSFHKVSYPHMGWTEQMKVHCSTSLALGLGESISWEEGNAPTLVSLLTIYERINQTPVAGQAEGHAYLEKNDQTIHFLWKRVERQELELRISLGRTTSLGKLKLVKNIGLYLDPTDFKVSIFRQLIGKVPKEVRNKYGELLFHQNTRSSNTAKFRIGDYVKTLIGDGVTTERAGFVRERFYHGKEQRFRYKLWIDDRTYSKVYRENQLELQETSV